MSTVSPPLVYSVAALFEPLTTFSLVLKITNSKFHFLTHQAEP